MSRMAQLRENSCHSSAVGLRSASGPWAARKLPRTALQYSSTSVVG
jgi:hypothetical protein